MPWSGQSFAERHNHSLGPARAGHAARIANAMLRRGAPEGESIATANKMVQRRDVGGGVDPTQAGVGGLTPSAQTMSPLMQGLIQRYSSLPPEKLQELASRLGGTQQGQLIRQLLQRKLMQPNAQQPPQQQVGTLNPTQAVQAGTQMMQPPMARGGWVRRDAGGVMPPQPPQPTGPLPPARPVIPQPGMPTRPPMIPPSPESLVPRPAPIHPMAAPGTAAPAVPWSGPAWDATLQNLRAQTGNANGGVARRAFGGDMGVSPSQASPWWTRQEVRGSESGSGFLSGTTGGRADAVNTSAPGGSYIIPSDVIAGLGDGNSLAGARVMDEVLRSGPHGIPPARGGRGMGPPRPPAVPRGAEIAKGGGVHGGDTKPTPVKLSHGEYQISPEDVARLGAGNIKRGHKVLDHFVLHVRKKYADKLRSLPPPVGSQA